MVLVRLASAATLEDARTALADRRYADAASILEKLKIETEDYRLYLLATAYHLGGQHDKAVGAVDRLLAEHPKSSWRAKALFKKADALMKLGRFADAEKIYEEQIARLASNERRGEIARVYLTHADQAFEPKRFGARPGEAEVEGRKPDYKAALKLYQRARELDALPKEADRVDLRVGLCHHHLKQHDQAIQQFEAFLKKHKKSKHVPDVLYHQGLALIARKDPDRARASFEKLLRDHADSSRAPEAQYKIATTYGLPKPRSEGDLNLGARALREFLRLYTSHKLAPKAGYEIGLSYFNFGQFDKAIEEYTSFVKKFAKKEAVEVGRGAYLVGQAHRRLNRFEEAIAAWQSYLRRFPAHEDWQKAQAAIVSGRYDHARYLFGKKKWPEAEQAFGKFAASYPLDGRNAEALFMLGQIPFEQKEYKDAVAAWRRAVAKFPRVRAGQKAQYRIASTLDRKLHDFEKAIEEYKKIKGGPFAGAAAHRLRALKEPHLAVTYERIFRTDEKPTLKVESRNIEQIQFKAYRLDAEDYFRRMGGFERIEQLDIALIDPHQEWKVPIKDYKKYEDIESKLELPLKGPGLFAVNASSEKLQATVMVLVTDVAILVKSSKKGVLVFAQNLRTGKPQPNARLLVSDGRKVILEGKTGDDGVYQGESDELKKVRAARVYAVADGNPASNALGLGRLGIALGLQPRGILYTDRPAYRPGEKVNYRGLIRLVSKGSYSTGKGQEVKVRVHSARGDAVHEADHKLSEFGTLAGELSLNSRDPLGEYRITASMGEGKPTFTGQFRVDEYQLPLYRIVFDFPKPTYFRGERIKGKVRVEYFFGQPVAGKQVRYRLRDQRWHTKTTDEKGEIEVEFETDFFRQTEVLPLYALLPAEGIASSRNILLTTTEYQAELTTLRDTYLVGEPFDVKVKATDFDDKPVAREVTVGLYRFAEEQLEQRPRRRGEQRGAPVGYVQVAAKTVTTAKETGEVTAQLAAKEGGRHLVRLEGLDSRKNLVTAQRRLFISGEEDKIRLRILSDSDEFRVGERPELNVVCRVGPALALLTWEGERIYRYRLVPLRKGSNRVPIDIPDECAPNFNLCAAVLHNNEFHHARKALAVLKLLRIALAPSKQELRPGEEVTVKVKTTDQAGKAVPAELSLAVVDEALYARYKDKLPKLSEFFHQRRRGEFYAMAASNGFKYAGRTVATSEALRRETERLARAPKGAPTVGFVARAGTTVAGSAEGTEPADDADMALRLDGGGGARGGGALAHIRSGRSRAGDFVSALGELRQQAAQEAARGHITKALADLNAANGGTLRTGLLLLSNGRAAAGQAGDPLNRPVLAVAFAPEADANRDRGRRRTALVRLREYFPQTAHWSPSLRTDAKGEGSVTFVMPDTTTAWRLVSRGLTTHHLVGEATASVVTKQPFSVELAAPAALTAGDKASVRASIRNFTGAEADTKLTFTATVGSKSETTRLRRKVAAGKVHKEFLDVAARPGPQAALKLEAKAADQADAVARKIPIRPWGIPVRVGASGRATDSVTVQLALPAGKKYAQRSLMIAISPSLPRDLVEAVLRGPTGASCTEQTIASGYSALSAIEMLDRLGAPPANERARLAAVVEESIRTLTLTQRTGGWTWAFESRHSRLDPFVTAYALEFLRRAEQSGFTVPRKVAEVARRQAKKLFASANALAEKAAVLYGLSFWGDADYSYVNRLDRLHPRLDNQSLALLVLTFLNLERRGRATELTKVLLGRSGLVPLPARPGQRGRMWAARRDEGDLWRAEPIEATALALEAIQRTMPRAKEVGQIVEWLLDQRRGRGWGAPRATAAAIRALATYVGTTKAEPQRYTLDLVLNGTKLRTLSADGMRATVDIEVPAQQVRESNRLDFRLRGRGEFAYVCTLEGITDGIPPAGKPEELEVKRRYDASPLLFEGVEIPRGYSTVRGPHKTIKNPVDELPEGKTCDVLLEVHVRKRQRYIVAEDYLPAGTSIIERTIQGNFDRYELGHSRVTFYFSNPGRSQWLHARYRLSGRFRGQYKVLPARAYAFYSPYELVVGGPYRMAVLPEGAEPKRRYEMTPDELYHLGKKHYEREDHAKAEPLLRRLFEGYRLADAPFKETVKMLLYLALAKGEAKAVVDYFEILKERYPELVIPFEKIIAVARAYRQRGEHERAIQVFRAIAEGFYFQEGNVAGVLEEAGDFIAATEFLERLLAEHPDLPVVQSGLYSLAQKIYATLPKLETDERLRKRTTRKELLAATRGLLQRFLELYPDNPIADEVSFTLASSYLEDESYDRAVALCTALQTRYPKSPLLDSFQYITGYSYFVTDRPKQALVLCRKVATGKYPSRKGKLALSDDRFNAIHMIAQVYHAQRQHEQAIAEYEKVKTHFADAREALAFLKRRHLALPEVTTVVPGKKAAVEVKYRNVATCDLKVYKVDLMTLYLLERNLLKITRINLAGIKPQVERRVELGAGKDYAEKKHSLALAELSKPGAYLLVCKAQEVECSGMLLISSLDLRVQEDRDRGRLRANVRDQDGNYQRKVYVKVIGTGNRDFKSGHTDLRGVFEGAGIRGVPTAIARKGDHYAFYRGTQALLTPRPKRKPRPPALARPEEPELGNVRRRLRQFQFDQDSVWQRQTRTDQRGVQVERAK